MDDHPWLARAHGWRVSTSNSHSKTAAKCSKASSMRPRTMPIKSSIPSGDPRVIRVLFGPNRGVFHEDLQLGVAAQVQHERAGARALEAQDSPGELEVSPRCQRNCYIRNVVLFEENSILPLPECSESSGWQFLKVEVSQESPKNPENREKSA